jgi:hypothetical protein
MDYRASIPGSTLRAVTRAAVLSLSAVLTAGVLAVGSHGAAASASHADEAQQTAASRNKMACEYVLFTWSGLSQKLPKGYKTSNFNRIVAGTTSPILRQELSTMDAANDSRNLVAIAKEGGEMVLTCYKLGLGHVDQ